ncbi:unnamed protein product [Ectocarpus sp. 12 AP-2014]
MYFHPCCCASSPPPVYSFLSTKAISFESPAEPPPLRFLLAPSLSSASVPTPASSSWFANGCPAESTVCCVCLVSRSVVIRRLVGFLSPGEPPCGCLTEGRSPVRTESARSCCEEEGVAWVCSCSIAANLRCL